jgi:hypothetical protein
MTQPLPPAVVVDADFETWQDTQPRIADLGDMPWLVNSLAPLPDDLRGLTIATVLDIEEQQ